MQACPAVNTFERRIIEIPAPFSFGVRCVKSKNNNFDFHLLEDHTRIDDDLISNFITFMPRDTWRTATAPVVQIALPHIFVSDQVCYLSQMPPWASANGIDYPGQFIGGRFPTHIWPRSLNLSFEWTDIRKDFRMKRDQAACYLFIETSDPEASIRLCPSKMTDGLKEYRSRIEDVVKFTSGSFKLFDEVAIFRPVSLLSEV